LNIYGSAIQKLRQIIMNHKKFY